MSTAVTLLESSKFTSPEMKEAVVETVEMFSDLLARDLPVIPIKEGFTFTYNEEVANNGSGIAFRALNENYTSSVGIVVPRTESMAFFGGQCDVDVMLDASDPTAMQREIQMKLKNLSRFFNNQFINGDVTSNPKGFDGLKRRLTGKNLINDSALDIDGSGGDFLNFLGLLDQAFRTITGNPTHIYMNQQQHDSIIGGARKAGADMLGFGFNLVDGRINAYRGAQFRILNDDEQGNEILPYTENSNTSSMYVVKHSTLDGVAGFTKAGIMITGPARVSGTNANRTIIDAAMGLVVMGNAAVRIQNLL